MSVRTRDQSADSSSGSCPVSRVSLRQLLDVLAQEIRDAREVEDISERIYRFPTKKTCPMSSYFFSTPVDIDIVLEDADDRQTVDVKLDKNRREKAPLYMDGESVKGAVTVRPKDGRRLEHTGIKVQFIGLIGTKHLIPNVACSERPRRLTCHFRDVL